MTLAIYFFLNNKEWVFVFSRIPKLNFFSAFLDLQSCSKGPSALGMDSLDS